MAVKEPAAMADEADQLDPTSSEEDVDYGNFAFDPNFDPDASRDADVDAEGEDKESVAHTEKLSTWVPEKHVGVDAEGKDVDLGVEAEGVGVDLQDERVKEDLGAVAESIGVSPVQQDW
jgi:hypothetical protein